MQYRHPYMILLVLTLAMGSAMLTYRSMGAPLDRQGVARVVVIPRGTSLSNLARLLQTQGVIRSARAFTLLAVLKGVATRLQAGQYWLGPHLTPSDILRILFEGRVIRYQVTIPEGSTLQGIAYLPQLRPLANPKSLLTLASDRQFLQELQIQGDSLEGYLFPDTYFFAAEAKARQILQRMWQAMDQLLSSETYRQRMEQLGLNRHQVLTLASLIEKEAQIDAERPLISAVFHNRLRLQMPLQADPTVLYAMQARRTKPLQTPHRSTAIGLSGGPDAPISRDDLQLDSPYNTYRRLGLPPGPIANPGQASLQAALYPERVNYLFFVAKNDGTHHFSRSLAEHNRAVSRYQRSHAPNRQAGEWTNW